MQALNRPLSLALAGALLLCLTGCGQIRPSGTTDSAAPAAESDLLQFQDVYKRQAIKYSRSAAAVFRRNAV